MRNDLNNNEFVQKEYEQPDKIIFVNEELEIRLEKTYDLDLGGPRLSSQFRSVTKNSPHTFFNPDFIPRLDAEKVVWILDSDNSEYSSEELKELLLREIDKAIAILNQRAA